MSLSIFAGFKHYATIAFALSMATASPIVDSNADLDKRAGLDVVLTTKTPSGQIIDWIPFESQGQVVPPPTDLITNAVPFTGKGAQSELLLPGVQLGPPGTVPVPRMSAEYLANQPKKQPPPIPADGSGKSTLKKRDGYSGKHWYVNSGQSVTNYGSQASFSLFSPYTAGTCDLSLIQTAVARFGAQMPGNPSANTTQTVEAGWLALPCQVSQPHIFTYYTINGYQTEGDYAGGYNQIHKGWVQYSQTYFPGTVLTPTSVINGTQNEMQLTWQLVNGNYYLSISGPNIKSQIMGYYPGTLFSANTAPGATTLANNSNYVAFYGEIGQGESNITTTDMGSGAFGSTGYNQSAYIHSMYYLSSPSQAQFYTAAFVDDNTALWNHGNSAPGGSDWAKYVYLGGPGAGLTIGS